MKNVGFIMVISAVLIAGAMMLLAPLAFADEQEASSSSSSSSASNEDCIALLESIDSKLDGLASSQDVDDLAVKVEAIAKSEDVSGLKTVVEALKPMDNTTRIDSLNKFMASIESVSLFQWVTLLLLVGVCLALVFLVSYRSHT